MVLQDRNETLAVNFSSVSSSYSTFWAASNDYTALGALGLFSESNIDLSGYAMEDLTFATFETMYQDAGIYSCTDAAGVAPSTLTKLEVIELISDVPFSAADLADVVNNMGTIVPGMIGTKQDFRQIIYGNYRVYVPNTTLGLPGYLQMISSSGFGSKEPTAAAKLYSYRLIKGTGATATDVLTVPACRVGLSGRMYREDELPYMMRLKRSYELQQLLD